MVADLARTIAIVGHREVKAGRAPCHRCGMWQVTPLLSCFWLMRGPRRSNFHPNNSCQGNQQAPPPGALLSSQSASSTMHAGNHSYPGASRSRASTPQLTTDTPTSSSGTVGKNGVVYVPCLDCGRQASNVEPDLWDVHQTHLLTLFNIRLFFMADCIQSVCPTFGWMSRSEWWSAEDGSVHSDIKWETAVRHLVPR